MYSHKKTLLSLWVTMAAAGIPLSQAQAQEGIVEEVIVQGVRSAELNAREVERERDIFSSVISQDDAGNFADQNVAEALQRLPGITLQKSDGQGEFVNVRGLGPGFVSVSLNNSELASSSTDSRAVALNAIPADLMGSIEVFKSLTPDMDLNSIGGQVNVNSVTAFDRGRDTLRFSLQGAMHEQRGEFSPKVTVQGTKLLADNTIGIGVSLSHEERATEVNQIHHSSSNDPRYIRVAQPRLGHSDSDGNHAAGFRERGEADPYIDNPRMLTPFEFEVRQDESVRTRNAGTIDLGWRPTSASDYYARFSRTDYTDAELTLREYFRFGQGTERYIAYVDPENNAFAVSNADLQQHVFIEESNAVTTTWALGGENVFNDTWTIDYEFNRSTGKEDNPDDRRVQFRIRALPLYGEAYQDDIYAQILARTQILALAQQMDTEVPSTGVPGTGGYVAGGGYRLGERRQEAMEYDNIFLEDGHRLDEIQQLKFNLRKDFDHQHVNFFKTGFQIKERSRDRIRDRWSVNPSDFPFACQGDRDCLDWANTSIGRGGFDTYTPRNPRFDHDFITVEDAENLIATTRMIPINLDPERSGHLSTSQDYSLYEDTMAAYVMAEFQLNDKTKLITGVRYEETEYGSTGYLSIRNDRFIQEAEVNQDIAIRLTPEGEYVVNKYDDLFPSIHLRYEPRDDLLIRTALWTSFSRPSFNQARSYAAMDGRVILCNRDPETSEIFQTCSDNLQSHLGAPDIAYVAEHLWLGTGNAMNLGNSDLVAMNATNFDASVSWYAHEDLFVEAAFFYKQISDFIVDVRGVSVARDDLPAAVGNAIDQITQFNIDNDFVFNDVNYTINGDKANVYGVELSYSQYFDLGFFIQSNMTLISSSADAGETVRADKISLPNQADLTANLTIGWENDSLSARLINNYRSKVLKQIGSCSQADIDADTQWASANNASNPNALEGATGTGIVYPEACRRWADVYHDAIFGMDFKATYNLNDKIRFYFDVLNITEDVDVYYFRGNEYSNGPMLFESESLGRTYQLGVTVRF